jgi:hypothetical protein
MIQEPGVNHGVSLVVNHAGIPVMMAFAMGFRVGFLSVTGGIHTWLLNRAGYRNHTGFIFIGCGIMNHEMYVARLGKKPVPTGRPTDCLDRLT